ncbi:MAG: hypothetical protein GY795_40285 [Desulfobacterales bacterium]|nr:hypothetical protein [Desulfobacterales bacterium]
MKQIIYERKLKQICKKDKISRLLSWFYDILKERGILHTDEEELNSLLESFGVGKLPKEL